MKKFILSAICFSFISSIACAIPPTLRTALLEAGEGIKFMAKRSVNTLRITPGFRPEKQPEVPFQQIERPGRVRFLDHNHEFYVPINRQIVSTPEISSPKVTREDNHSVRVDLDQKKK